MCVIPEVPAWSDRVRRDLGEAALVEFVELLAHGDLEQQYQAVAAAVNNPGASWPGVELQAERRRRDNQVS